ncbi:MAG: hypothetical protein ACI4JD_06675 [Ruminococcus sp.]
MNIIKKIFAAVTAVASAGVFAFASVTASAAGELDPSETAPYTARMAIQAGKDVQWEKDEENTVEFSADGTYTTSYTFKMGSTTIEALVLDTSINAASFAPAGSTDPIKDCTVKISVDKIELVKKDGTTSIITYTGPSDDAFCLGDNGKCCRLNILNMFKQPAPVKDIYETLPDTGAAIGDKLSLTFTVSGLGGTPAGTTTSTTGTDDGSTTTTTTTVYNGNTFNSGNNNSGGKVNYTTTSTVTQTADAGVIAIVVSATAAAALAAGAMTIRRKKK